MFNNDTDNSNAQKNTPKQSPTFYESTQMKNNQLLNNIQDRVSNVVLLK
jgi:hypothetical protein